MAGFVWKRVHTIAAAGTALVLVGVGTAVALGANDDTGITAPPALTPSASATPALSE